MGCVLVVEDNDAIRESIQIAIESQGYVTYGAANGKEGLELLITVPQPCLILLDLMMPVMNGWEFAKHLRESDVLATIPVVVVTAYADKAQEIPAREVIKKPFDLSALLGIVEKYCPHGGGARDAR